MTKQAIREKLEQEINVLIREVEKKYNVLCIPDYDAYQTNRVRIKFLIDEQKADPIFTKDDA